LLLVHIGQQARKAGLMRVHDLVDPRPRLFPAQCQRQGQTYVEIAEELGVPLWVVQKQMLKAIKHVVAHREANDD